MHQEIALFISNTLVFSAYIIYIISILRGKAKPHRTTRLVLLLITGLATLSLFAQQNYVAVWLAGISTVMSLFIFLLSVRFGMGGWEKLDILCLIIALFGIFAWKITNNPVVALFASILADFTGIFPTITKTYHHPKTEVWIFFAIGGLGALFNIFAIQTWTVHEVIYPLYLVVINFLLVGLILRKNIQKLLKMNF